MERRSRLLWYGLGTLLLSDNEQWVYVQYLYEYIHVGVYIHICSNIVGWFQNMKLVYSCTPYQYIIFIMQYMQYVIFILRNKWEVWRFHNSSPPNIFRPPRSNNSGYKCGPIYETFTFIHLYGPLTIAKLSHFSPSKLIWIHETLVVVLPNLYV